MSHLMRDAAALAALSGFILTVMVWSDALRAIA